jgi:hypothetical protein
VGAQPIDDLVPLATLLGIFVYREIRSAKASETTGDQG